MMYKDEFIDKGFKYLHERLKKFDTKSIYYQLISITILDNFLDQACLLIVESINFPLRTKRGENFMKQILVILLRFIELDTIQ